MDDVLPDWISCKWRNRFNRALPRPLSSSPWVSTPRRVLLPASMFPSTANRMSKNCWSSGTFRMRTSCTQRCSEVAVRTVRLLNVVRLAPSLCGQTLTAVMGGACKWMQDSITNVHLRTCNQECLLLTSSPLPRKLPLSHFFKCVKGCVHFSSIESP